LIAVPVLCVASGYELLKLQASGGLGDGSALVIGFVVSFIVALVAVKGFVRYLAHGRLIPFAWYRVIVAPLFYWLTRGTSL
jgi:undecaprenyl-diphosphatase